jgi:large subunit ribosomal protein L7e
MTATTVPTRADILVPETLLKKRKSQEKAREQRASELLKRREVLFLSPCRLFAIVI